MRDRKPQPTTVALIQMDVGPERADNLARARALLARAAKRGAQICCLPELFSYMGSFHDPNAVAEDERGPTLTMLRTAAREHRMTIVGGSVLMRQRRGLPRNTCFLLDRNGRIRAHYSKLHLFDIEVKDRIRFLESRFMQAGTHATVAKTPAGVAGFAICNDLRYPELFRKMITAGARIIFLPAAFTKFTGRDHWLALTRVRAIENQCFLIAVNQSGRNVDHVRFFGSSVAIDPWGKVIAEGPAQGDAIVMAQIDPTAVDRIRRELPALKKIRRAILVKRF